MTSPPENLLIENARIIDPSRQLDAVGALTVRAGRIVATDPPTDVPGETLRIDATGLIACPGLIDPHVHLREPGAEHKETIATGCQAAGAGGFTTVCCMPNTDPPIDNVNVLTEVIERARKVNLCRVRPIAAITRARAGRELTDFKALHGAGAVAFSDDGDGVEDDRVMRRAMLLAHRTDALIVQHCEFKNRSKRGIVHLGAISRRLGVVGYDPAAEERMIARDIDLAAQTGARYHVAHVSTARGVELLREAKRRGVRVSGEVCPHHLLLCDEDVVGANGQPDPNFKMSPPLRARQDVEACVAGVIDGTIDCIASDHAPHTAAEKSAGFEQAPMGIIGLETSLACSANALLHRDGFNWMQLIERMSTACARVFKLPGGTLAPGSPGDITLIDPDRGWVVDPQRFRSPSRNTPFSGWHVTGRVVATICAGQLIYADVETPPGSEPGA